MKILTLNCGSSSVKFRLIDTSLELIEKHQDREIASGLVEKIGLPDSVMNLYDADKKKIPVDIKTSILDHTEAIEQAIFMLTEHRLIKSRDEIEACGHRVLHGAEMYHKSLLVTPEVMHNLNTIIDLGPLHMPHNIAGIRAAQAALPGRPQVAVFDTGFHATMPDYAYRYAIPDVLYRRHKIRRYGFHGISHRYVSQRVGIVMGRPREEMKIITVHLGNGSSLAAVDHGKVVDTSMGFTPAEGLVMGTRACSIDPTVILKIMEKERITLAQADSLLNKHSGVLGVSGVSNDMRELMKARDKGNDNARLALDIFVHVLKRHIGAYLAVLDGADVIVFTGGIGENSAEIRRRSTEGLRFAGITLDQAVNDKGFGGFEGAITTPDSKIAVYVVPTNEELVIARDTVRVINGVTPP